MFKHIKIRNYEYGLLFRDREFKRLLEPGSYWLFDFGWLLPWLGKLTVEVVCAAIRGCCTRSWT